MRTDSPVSTAFVCPAHTITATRSHSWYGTAPNMARTEVEEHELQAVLLSTMGSQPRDERGLLTARPYLFHKAEYNYY